MDKTPLISFVIPVYNVPTEMICECVESITALPLQPFEREIIIVDDGSDQSSLQAMTDISDVIFLRQDNMGVSAARNMGINNARGQYIQFVDADDVLTSAYNQVIELLRTKQADMVMFDFTHDRNDTQNYCDDGPHCGTRLMCERNIHGSVCCFVFKTDILGNLRFTPGIAYGEDEEFTPQLLLHAKEVYTTTAKAYFYRQRPSSAVHTVTTRKKLQRLNDTKQVLLNLHNMGTSMSQDVRKALRRRTAQLTMDYIYNVIMLTRNGHYLDRQIQQLRKEGLFPLPDLSYTNKYRLFRWMTNTKVGRAFMLVILPLMKRER